MLLVTTAMQFIAGCLTLGLGLFLIAGALRDLSRVRLLPSVGTHTVTARKKVVWAVLKSVPSVSARTVTALGGALLLAAGGYAAHLAVPL